MENSSRFFIAKIHICPIKEEGSLNIKPDLERYSERVCVIDRVKMEAVDVFDLVKYKYIETISWIYLITSIKDILPGERVAICQHTTFCTKEESDKACQVKQMLINGEVFENGNNLITNEEYLELRKNERIKENEQKIKKFNKKRAK